MNWIVANWITCAGVIIVVAVIFLYHYLCVSGLKKKLKKSDGYGKRIFQRLLEMKIIGTKSLMVPNYTEVGLTPIFHQFRSLFGSLDIGDSKSSIYANEEDSAYLLQAFEDLFRLYGKKLSILDSFVGHTTLRNFFSVWTELANERLTNRQDYKAFIYFAAYFLKSKNSVDQYLDAEGLDHIFKEEIPETLFLRYGADRCLGIGYLLSIVHSIEEKNQLINSADHLEDVNIEMLGARLRNAIMYRSFRNACRELSPKASDAVEVSAMSDIGKRILERQFPDGEIPQSAVDEFLRFVTEVLDQAKSRHKLVKIT
ncbi:MAG: hypothetical protein GY793_11365 [Proteobacteria bacterium]|nr:hypothetical protein [Pseudomonadota bacterium]